MGKEDSGGVPATRKVEVWDCRIWAVRQERRSVSEGMRG